MRVLLALSLFLLIAPQAAQATMYAPGATLDPACAPTDSNCGVQSNTAVGTLGQVPYYAAAGNVLAATSTMTILSNGNVSIGNMLIGQGTGMISTFPSDHGGYSVAVGNGFTAGDLTSTSYNNYINLVYGAPPAQGAGAGFQVARTLTGDLNTHAFQDWSILNQDQAYADGYASYDAQPYSEGSKLNHFVAYQSRLIMATSSGVTYYMASFDSVLGGTKNSGGGNVLNYMGMWLNDITNSNGSTVTNDYGVNISSVSAGTNNYGLYIGNVSGGTNSYQIYSSGTAPSYFGGNIGIGTSSPGQKLDVVGNINISAGSAYMYNGANVITASTTLNNYFFGNAAGNLTMTGISNTASGFQALSSNTTGSFNTASGVNALNMNNTGIGNTADGIASLYLNTVGNYNTASGYTALFSNATGTGNTASGFQALRSNTTGDGNTASGSNALTSNTTGSFNTAYGASTFLFNISATSSIAVGTYAAAGTSAYTNQGGTYLGYQSGYSAATGSDYNTLVGYRSGYGITTGSNNIWIGTATSSTGIANLTTGSQNILIGNNISLHSATASGQLNIGNLIFGTGVTGTGSTLSTGNVGIGTTTPYSRLTVWGPDALAGTAAFTIANSASTTEFQVFDNGSATLAGTLTQNSDERLKQNITSLDASSTLAAIASLTPVSFIWRDPSQGSTTQLGFIAQDVQKIFPQLVSTTSATALTPGGTLGINYIGLISPLIEAVKELAGKVSGFAQSITTAVLNATTVHTDNLCIGSTCVTESQLKTLLQNNGQQSNFATNPITITDVPVSEINNDSVSTSTAPLPDTASTTPVISEVAASTTPAE